jgi:hypothetical protein
MHLIYSLLYNVQTISEVHPASYAIRLKRTRCEADHSLPSGAEVKINISTAPYVFMAWW